ncbi:MAG: hypothetical protein EDX89_09950 [Acidobacteria bacterium]|nr:MAG: hypothetical protein EDX89_09950 [Acidobacteriota bacterium]
MEDLRERRPHPHAAPGGEDDDGEGGLGARPRGLAGHWRHQPSRRSSPKPGCARSDARSASRRAWTRFCRSIRIARLSSDRADSTSPESAWQQAARYAARPSVPSRSAFLRSSRARAGLPRFFSKTAAWYASSGWEAAGFSFSGLLPFRQAAR